MTAVLSAALEYVSLGLQVRPGFKLGPDGRTCNCPNPDCSKPGKHPVYSRDKDKKARTLQATDNADQVRRDFAQFPNSNVRIATGPGTGLAVLDVDRHTEAKDGFVNLAGLEDALQKRGQSLPTTPTALSAGDGEHRYFRVPDDFSLALSPSSGKPYIKIDIAPGLELLYGQDATAPPSTLGTRSYRWKDGLALGQVAIAEAPAYLLQIAAEKSREGTGAPPIDKGAQIPVGERGKRIISVAKALYRNGASDHDVRIAVEPIIARFADPIGDTWSEADIVRALKSAERYAQNSGPYEPKEEARRPTEPDPSWGVMTTVGLLSLSLTEGVPRVQDLFTDGTIVLVSGRGGSHKTWVSDDIALSVASGQPFLGKATVPGPVLILQLEGSHREHQRRIRTLCHGRGITGSELEKLPLYHRWGRFNLSETKPRELLRAWVKEFQPVLITIDNLRLAFKGNEDSSEFAAELQQIIQDLQEDCPCTYLLVHHQRKRAKDQHLNDPGELLRGSGGLRNMSDYHAVVTSRADGSGVLTVDKYREGEVPPPIAFKFVGPEKPEGAGFVNLGAPKHHAEAKRDATTEKVAQALWRTPGVAASAIAQDVGISDATAKTRLGDLEEKGKARREGKGKATRWYPCGEVVEHE